MKNSWTVCLVLLGCVSVTTLWARELTPLEKALKVLAQKNQATSATNTATAMASVNAATRTSPHPVALTGNTATTASSFTGNTATTFQLTSSLLAQAGGSTITALGATLTAQKTITIADALALTLSATAEEIVVSWGNTASSWTNFGGYMLMRSDMDHEAAPLTALPMATNTYRDVSVTPKVLYDYTVWVVDPQGVSLAASALERMQLVPSQPPNTPKHVQSSLEEERARVFWSPVQPTSHAVVGYAVYRSNSMGAEGQWINKKIIKKNEFYDDSGVYGETYAYQVAAVDAWGATGEASTTVTAYARFRSRSGLVLMSTAYRGFGRNDTGLNADMQFTYYIGTLYGDQDKTLSSQPLYLDPISLWLLTADAKYTLLTEETAPLAVAGGAKGSLSLYAGQQSSTGGSFTFSGKSSFNTLWGTYLAMSRTFGNWGIHGGYMWGTEGNAVYYLSKYLEPTSTRNVVYAGLDFPIVRRMNVAVELLVPTDDQFRSELHPWLINTHVDRLFNFDISYLHWDRGWALLGYFNLRFTLFPASDK